MIHVHVQLYMTLKHSSKYNLHVHVHVIYLILFYLNISTRSPEATENSKIATNINIFGLFSKTPVSYPYRVDWG